MSLIVGLMILGFGLIMLEIFIPGGVVGLLGGASLLGAIGLAYGEFGMEGALIAFAVAIVGLAICLYVEFKVLPKTRVGRRIFLNNSVSGKSQPDVGEATLVGKEGTTLTALSPSGQVLVEGRKLEAVSRSGFLEKGEHVRVDSLDQFKVTVSKR